MFGEKIKQLRKQANLTQEELGKKLGVAKNTVSYWESNDSQPSLDTIKEISNLFQVSVDYLLGNEIDDLDEMNKLKRLLKQAGLMKGDDLTKEELEKALKIVEMLRNNK